MDNEPRRLSPRGMALYSVAAIGGGFFYIFNNAVLPLLIPSSNVLLVNLMSNTRSIEGAVIQPVVGAWSDRLWTRLGRRRPFMLIAMPLCALFMALTPLAPSLPLIVACIFVFSLLFNVAADPYQALQGDIAPPSQRPTLNAVATVVGYVGQVALGLFIAFGPFGKHIPALVYPLTALGILVTFLVTVVTVPERRADGRDAGAGDAADGGGGHRQRVLLADVAIADAAGPARTPGGLRGIELERGIDLRRLLGVRGRRLRR